jgi:hypothetical protein
VAVFGGMVLGGEVLLPPPQDINNIAIAVQAKRLSGIGGWGIPVFIFLSRQLLVI